MRSNEARRRPVIGAQRPSIGSRLIVVVLPLVIAGLTDSIRADESPSPNYERDIKPMFARRCTVCHNASNRGDLDVSGGLALDTFEGVLAGTSRRKVIVAGRSAESELVRRLGDADEERRMPLQEKPLPEKQQELVRRWIDAGAARGVPVVALAGTVAGGARPRRARLVRSLDVMFPSDVTLKPKTLNSPRGGALSVSVRIGPLPAVTSMAFRGDSRLLAVGTYGQVVLWDLQDGRPATTVQGIPGPVHALAFSRDGRRLAVGAGLPARSGIVRVYSVPDGTLLHDFAGHKDVVFGLALRPDGAQLASTSFDQTVRFWDLGLGQASGVFSGHSDFVYAAAYTPDGRGLLTAGKDRMIKWINTRTFKEERTYTGHNEDVLSVAVHPDGTKFVSAGNEPQLRWWTFGADAPAARRGGHSGPVQQLAFSSDGRRLISAGGDRSVRLWDGKTGQPQRQLAGPTDWQYAAAIADDGKLAAAGGWDGLVRLWDADSGKLRATLVQPPAVMERQSISPDTELAPVDWLAVSPTGHLAGSVELIKLAHWRAGDVTLPDVDARRACVRPSIVAQAIRGEAVSLVSFPSNPGK
jgi:hypothetical protein